MMIRNTAHLAPDATPCPTSGRTEHPPGTWPPGPASGLTGWGLLRRMSRDLLGSLRVWQQAHGDVVHLRIWPEHQIVLTDPAAVRELLVSQADALQRWERGMKVFAQLNGHSVFTAEGEAWQAKRQALHSSFTPRSVQALLPMIADATCQALDAWPQHAASFPAESALTSLAMDVILRTVFSQRLGDEARQAEEDMKEVVRAVYAELYWPASWPDAVPWKRRKRQALQRLRAAVSGHLARRLEQARDTWPDDLASRLLNLQAQDPVHWPLESVHDECMTAFAAGHETTAATLAWWAGCMALHPDWQERVRAEVQAALGDTAPSGPCLPKLPLLEQTLQETLRLYPAVPVLNTRRGIRPVSIAGWHFPARTLFLIPVMVLHHDARWFPQPHEFRPERFAGGAPEIPRGAYLPFGAGPRVCLGQHLAMTELQAIAAMLLQRYRLALPSGEGLPEPAFTVSLRPRQPLRLSLQALGR